MSRGETLLVIFDCDGVLVDSEPIANRILAELLTEVGLPTRFEDSWRDYRGRTQQACIELAEANLGRPLPAEFGERFDTLFLAACSHELTPIPGVSAAIGELSALGFECCVASSGSLEKMHATLGHTALLELFEGRIFSAAEVARSKPHPDIFLYAAQRMGAAPGRCCVVEDSPLGVRAARAAGMPVLGFAPAHEAAMLYDAGARVFGDMAELPRLVADLAESRRGPRERSGGRRGT